MSYKVKAYANMRNKKDILDIGYNAVTENTTKMFAGAIPHILNDVAFEWHEMEGQELKITLYISESENVNFPTMEKKYKEFEKRKS